jgi:hypothetical protein
LNTINDLDINIVLKEENFSNVAVLMLTALKDKEEDYRIAQSACEFWLGLCCNEADDDELKSSTLKSQLPALLPLLMEGCLMTDVDRMNMIATKEEDAYDQKKPEDIQKEGQEEEEEEENYEVDLNADSDMFSLRKTAGYTI